MCICVVFVRAVVFSPVWLAVNIALLNLLFKFNRLMRRRLHQRRWIMEDLNSSSLDCEGRHFDAGLPTTVSVMIWSARGTLESTKWCTRAFSLMNISLHRFSVLAVMTRFPQSQSNATATTIELVTNCTHTHHYILVMSFDCGWIMSPVIIYGNNEHNCLMNLIYLSCILNL